MMRTFARLGAALICLALVLGPPAAVALWALTRPPQAWPTRGRLRDWLIHPPPVTAAVVLIAVIVTALWIWISVVVIRRTMHRVRRAARRLPLPNAAQATAGTLAGTALLGVAVHQSGPTAPPPTITATALSSPNPAAAVPPATGVDLPGGGWIPNHDAEQVAAMFGLYWLRRRQLYQPGQAAAAPLASDVVLAAAAAGTDPVAATTETATGPVTLEDLHDQVYALAGPGAPAAARALMVTTLMRNTTIGAVTAHVVVTADDLHLLLTDITPARPPGLHVADSAATVGALLDHLPAPTPASPGPATRLVHITTAPPPQHDRPRTTVVLTAAGNARGGWHIAADGTITGNDVPAPARARLCVLTTRAAADLLTLITHTHHPPPGTQPGPSHTSQPVPPPGPVTHPPAPPHPHAGSPRPVRLTVLGDLDLSVDNRRVAIRRTAGWPILVILATHRDGVTGRDLITSIWPGPVPATITNRLHTTLHHLRTQVRNHRPDIDVITQHDQRYALNAEVVEVDLWEVHTAARTAATALTTTERRHAHDRIITSPTEIAPGHRWPWLAPHQETVRQLQIDAYIDRVTDLPAADAIGLLRQAITVDPVNETLQAKAIAVLTDLGDHDAAARLTATFAHRLADSGLSAPPPPATPDT